MSGSGTDPRPKLSKGFAVFGVLLLLEVIEFGVGQVMKAGNVIPLAILAVAAAWLILRYYMHVQQLREGGEK